MLRKEKKKYPLVNGKPIRYRRFQQLCWIGISAVFGAGFIAGLYWLGLQQHYPFLPGSGSAKLWWDNGMGGMIRSPHWDAYRHAIRNNGEPELWAMVGAVLLGKARGKPGILLPGWALVIATLLLLIALIAGAAGIAWLTVVGPLRNVTDIFSLRELILGFILGRILHLAFSPVGSTIRYRITSSAAARAGTPLWVALPLMPPTWRESWSELRARMTGTLKERKDRFRQSRVLVPLMVLIFLVVAVIGNLAKYAVAHGMHVPGMN